MRDKFATAHGASAKIQMARDFSERLWNGHIEFIGISGSVSYDPKPEDDIDIFLITKNGWLWPELVWAFILRRILKMEEICLSLSLDRKSAARLFQGLNSLQEKDAMHVIPIKGHEFYLELLRRRKTNAGNEMEPASSHNPNKVSPGTFMDLINIALFLLMSPLQKMKELRFNSLTVTSQPELVYHIVMDPGRLILDSEKYRKLSESGEWADD